MTDLRTAAQQALEALEAVSDYQADMGHHRAAISALRAALAEPAEPVAFDIQKALKRAYQLGQNYWADADSESYRAYKRADKHRQDFEALCAEALEYIAPPQHQPLSDEEVREVVLSVGCDEWGFALRVARAVEAAHGITTQETN